MSKVRIAAIQMRSGMDVGRNVEEFDRLVREAAASGASYVQSPEMTGLLVRDKAALLGAISGEAEDPIAARASELARELQICLHVGSTAIALDGGKVANRAFLFAPSGALLATYDKIHMFDVDLPDGESYRESRTYRPGRAAIVADLPWARLGLSICYDLRFPQLYRALAQAGATLLTVPAAFTRRTGEAHWHVLQRARAVENTAFVISAAQGGRHENGRETYGHSLIVAPWGEVLAEAGTEPGVILAEIDMARVDEARGRIASLTHDRPFAPPGTEPERRAS
jgi:deaminated glutathione amidase